MSSIKVSFVMPIYNVEKYVEKGIKSIVNQDYKNIEIILVDDGSTDSSGLIIDRLAATDNRIIVCHKKNGGVSSARNMGLSLCKGEYVVFVDGDDYIEKDYTNYFLKMVDSGKYDLAMNSKCFDLKNQSQTNYNEGVEYDSIDIMENIYIGKMDVAVWNKMYKLSFLKKNKLFFDESIWYGEGMLFNIQCLSNTDKVIVGNKLVYHQVFNTNSAMRKFNINSNFCGIKSLEIQKKFLPKEKRILYSWEFHERCFNMSILKGLLKSNTKDKYLKDYYNSIKNLRKNIFLPLKVNISKKKKLFYLAASINPVLVARISIMREKKLINKYKTR